MQNGDFMNGIDIKVVALIIIALVIAVYVFIDGENKRKKKIVNKLKKGWGQIPERKYSAEEYENITHYFRKCEKTEDIDDITWNDLGMDSVFKLINNTNSSVGEEYLYRRLRQPATAKDDLVQFDSLCEKFASKDKERLEIQKIFVWLGRTKRISVTDYVDLIFDFRTDNNLVNYLSGILILAAILVLILVTPVIGIWLVIAAIAFSIITYYRQKARAEKYFVCINQIVKMLMVSQKISDKKYEFLSEYTDKLEKICKSFSKITKNAWLIESGNVDGSLMEMLLDYLRMLTHVDLIKFNNMCKLLGNRNEELYEMIDTLGFIESAISVASFRQMLPYWCRPEFTESGKCNIKVDELFHPLIKNPVSNSINTNRNVLLTGSNASGKSTFLKSVAINCILSQTIYTSTSKKYIAPMFRIYSSMALKDDLGNSDSYYIVEIKSLKRILDAIDNTGMPVICFIDEVLRGTNTVERIAASSEILKSLKNKNALCFAATHDIELTTLLSYEYDNYHFQEEVTDDDVKFNYKLYKGPTTTRNAIKLLKVMGYNKDIVDSAENRANMFLNKGTWNS